MPVKTFYVRFGRRVAIPSTAQIRHEIRVFGEREERERIATLDGLGPTASWDDIIAHRVAAANARPAPAV
jgi:hypothetical protein